MLKLKFAQMLCSRICHDLINPVGAINSSFELLEECEPAEKDELLKVMSQSAAHAARKLIYYRAAFGYTTTAQYSSFTSLKPLMENYLNPLKINLHLPSLQAMDEEKYFSTTLSTWARFLINIVLMGAEGMPYGGDIHLISGLDYQKGTQDFLMKINFKGGLVAVRPEVLSTLHHQFSERNQTPYTILALMINMLATQLSVKLQPNHNNNQEFEIKIMKQS